MLNSFVLTKKIRAHKPPLFLAANGDGCVDWSGGVRDYIFERLPVDARVNTLGAPACVA